MISFNRGRVCDIREANGDVAWIWVEIDGDIQRAVNYKKLTGDVEVGDTVVLNTTAVELSLGTGGEHFVISNLNKQRQSLSGEGHIMKLRYTPMQMKCFSCEEQDSPYHQTIKNFESLKGSKFIVGTLHSMLAPIASYIKKRDPSKKINYIMTDAGALPLAFSKTVTSLKEKGIIDNTITVGQSFGGDYEAVNIYTGLIVASEVLKSDITIVAMGPGIAGTGTKYGFSGIEQAAISDAILNLGGRSILVPRISFADKRDRHSGISHHSLTVFGELTNKSAELVFPRLGGSEEERIVTQISDYKLEKKHSVHFREGNGMVESLDHYGLTVKTMGRGYNEDEEFFKALAAVGEYVLAT